jgi:Zn-dependent peptidase ImmA (M78 family)/transcriptional regulator with XRE-family HTH domain
MNPRVLTWARERSGLSITEAAASVARPVETVLRWEAGSEAPTFRQLEALAKAYRRPVALFFFPDPPKEPEPRHEFRTLPASEFDDFESDTYLAIREGRALQESLRELTGGRNPAERQIVRDIPANPTIPLGVLAEEVRTYLGVSLDEQRSWANATVAFKAWRRVVEASGVFVFKRSFDQRSISGFCLHDEEFPVIIVNNSTAHARQTFTLFHELAHLLFHISGITRDQAIKSFDAWVDPEIEVACNRFASEFLVPVSSFPWNKFRRNTNVASAVADVARDYNVSREVILRKLLDRAIVDAETYSRMAEEWNREFDESRSRDPGGNYYATQATYLGDRYLGLAFGQYHAGRVSLSELAEHLGMKARNIVKLEDFLLSRK